MALMVQTSCSLLLLILLINCETNVDYYRFHIASILEYLNSNPERIYNYNSGQLIGAQNKNSFTADIQTDIEVQCLVESKDAPCSTKILTCEGGVQFKPDTSKYEVVPPVNCNPKTERKLQSEDEVAEENSDTNFTEVLQMENINVQQLSEKKYHVCTGCDVDLNTNVQGLLPLIDTALKHIESERNKLTTLLEVLRVQQQVVSGIKYILLLKVSPTICTKDVEDPSLNNCPVDLQSTAEYCQIEYLQQLWISREKNIISNNCTESQEYKATNSLDQNNLDNEIDPNQISKNNNKILNDFEHIAQTGQIEEINPSYIESQIIQDTPIALPKIETMNSTPNLISNTDRSLVEEGYAYVPMKTSTVSDNKMLTNIFTNDEKTLIDNFFENFFFDDETLKPTVQSKKLLYAQTFKPSKENLYDSTKQKSFKSDENKDSSELNAHRNLNVKQRMKRDLLLEKARIILVATSSEECNETFEGKKDSNNAKKSEDKAGRKTKSLEESSETSEETGKDNMRPEKKMNKRNVRKTWEENYATLKGKSVRFNRSPTRSTDASSISNSEEENNGERNIGKLNIDDNSSDSSSEEEGNNGRNKRANDDSRANSSLEKNIFNDESLNFVLKNYSESYASSEEKDEEEEEDSITRHKRDANSSSSSSSRSFNDDDGDDNEKATPKSKKVQTKNDDDNNANGNDSSSSSSSSSSCDGNDYNKKKKSKRSINTNGFANIEDNEEAVVDNLSEFVAATLDFIDDDNQKTIVLDILGVKKIKLEGLVYYLTVKVGISVCEEDRIIKYGKLSDVISQEDDECRKSLINDVTKICKVQVHVTEKYTNPKVMKSRCFISRENRINRRKRQLVGGITDISTFDQKVLQFTKQTLRKLDENSPHENKYKVLEILSASIQIVAGRLYHIKATITLTDCLKSIEKDPQDCGNFKGSAPRLCDIQIWDRPWLPNSQETNVTCDNENHLFRSIRSPQVPGGINKKPVNDPTILEHTKLALSQLDRQSNHNNKYKVIEILSASNQVVSGILYRIQAKIIISDCHKNNIKDPQHCGTLKNAQPKICNIKIWDQPWLPSGRETNVTCDGETQTFRSKRSTKFQIYLLEKGDDDLQFSFFQKFLKTYNKSYQNGEEIKYRFQVFKENMNTVRILNRFEKGTAKYGATKFADLTREEFKKLLGYRPDLANENELAFSQAEIPNINLPEEFDWRDKNAVTQVKNQGSCGSCWAFSVTGNVEGQYAIKHEKLLEFSEQELVDCDKYDEGCSGGLMDNAYRAIEQIGGLELEDDYPYDGANEQCHFKQNLAKVQLSGAVNISQDEIDMAKWLVQNGPISIAINANAMQFYFGGVSHPWKFLCNPKSLDHGVLIVGYGVHKYPKFNKILPYWLIKNSWGKSWGEQGYYRVYRGDGTCGLNQTPSSAIVE